MPLDEGAWGIVNPPSFQTSVVAAGMWALADALAVFTVSPDKRAIIEPKSFRYALKNTDIVPVFITQLIA